MSPSSCISVLCPSLLALLALLTGCAAGDPCDGQSGGCLSIDVEGSVPLDSMAFTLTGAVQDTATRPLPSGMTELPVQVAVLLPPTAQGTVSITATALKNSQTVALGMGAAAVTPGAHVHAMLSVQQINNTCSDGIKDGNETDVDCGGPVCRACDNGKMCGASTDCVGGLCYMGTCHTPSCTDGLADLGKTDMNCGGPACAACKDGLKCDKGSDCQGGTCSAGICSTGSCSDGVKDGSETDVDCGGSVCPPCTENKECKLASDCISDSCSGFSCAPALVELDPLTAMSPNNGPNTGGTILTLTGKTFLNKFQVMLGGVAATGLTLLSPTQVQVTTPPLPGGFGAVDLTVTDPDGSSMTNKNPFYYYGTLGFANATNTAAGTTPYAVAIADFNGDGKADLAVADEMEGVSVLLGVGDGTFLSAVTYATAAAPFSVAVGDLNGDGKPDLVTANFEGNNVSVLLNKGDGTGTFLPHQDIMTGTNAYSVAVGDLNGDGVLDLAVANFESNNVSVLLNKGDGTFPTVTPYQVGMNPASVAVGDLNGDGVLDLAVANSKNSSVSVLLGNGDGTFKTQVSYTVGNGPDSVAIADLNGDGIPDLAITVNSASVSVLLGSASMRGQFGSATSYPVDSGATSVTTADLNGDGISDIVTANYISSDASVLLGKGDGTFKTAQNFLADKSANGVAVGDLNGDGRPDIVTANSGATDVSVLLNTTH